MSLLLAIAAAALTPCLPDPGSCVAPPNECSTARAGLDGSHAGEADPVLKFSGWINPEIESSHITRGRIKVRDPVWNLDCGFKAETRDFGYFLGGIWSESDLTSRYPDVRRRCFSEIDPLVAYGYKYPFSEGWSLDTRLGLQWNWLEGYKGKGRRSYDEWRWWLTLRTPWLSAYALTRTFYYPYYAMAFKTGASSSIPIVGKLTFDPNVWFDGGSERWNRRRFGRHTAHTPNYRAGANSISVQLFLSYRFNPQFRIYGGVTEYVVIDPTVREQVGANHARTARRELLVVTLGMSYQF